MEPVAVITRHTFAAEVILTIVIAVQVLVERTVIKTSFPGLESCDRISGVNIVDVSR